MTFRSPKDEECNPSGPNYTAGQRMTVCLMGASLDTGNLGVSALAASALDCLIQDDADRNVFVLDYAKLPDTYTFEAERGPVDIPVVNIRFSKKLYLKNNVALLIGCATLMRLLPLPAIRKWLLGKNEYLRALNEVSVGAAISGGDSFSDIYGMPRLFYTTLPQFLLLLLGKRLVLLPQTIGPFKSMMAQFMARAIIRKAEAVYSRDRAGLDWLDGQFPTLAATGKFRFCNDVAFVLKPKAPSSARVVGMNLSDRTSGPIVGLNVSGLLLAGGYTGRNMFQLAHSYRELILDVVEHCISELKCRVLLIPHVFSKPAGVEDDLVASLEIYKEIQGTFPGMIGYLEGNYDQSEVKYIIGQCDFFIGSRMHACIAAVSQGVPALSLAYSSKFAGVMETIGIDDLVADLRRATKEQIIEQLNRGFEHRSELHDELCTIMPSVRNNVLAVFDRVTDCKHDRIEAEV